MKNKDRAMSCKVEVSDILSMITGRHHKYWLDDTYIRWGLVERDIHAVIDKALATAKE